jgi:integrase
MRKESLTAKQVQFMKPGAKRTEVPAGPPAGLYLVLHPTGKKSWMFRYRFRDRTRGLTFPKAYPELGLQAARAEAEAKLEELDNGLDPAATQAEEILEAEPESVQAVAEEWLTRYVKPNTRTKSAVEFERIIRADILPAWKDKLISEITKPDILRMLDKIVDRGAPIAANRTHEVIRMWLNWSVERGYLENSPADGIKAPSKEESRERALDVSEVTEVWNASKGLGYPLAPFIQILILTATRRGGAATMRWRDVDLDKALWTLPPEATGTKGRAHVVPLSNAAVELLRGLPVFPRGDYVFTTTSGRKPINGFSKVKSRIDKETLKRRTENGIKENIADWTLHDLRRTAATLMAEHGVLPHILSAILGHSGAVAVSSMPSALVTKIYNRYAYLDEKRSALEDWAQFILTLEDEKPQATAATA